MQGVQPTANDAPSSEELAYLAFSLILTPILCSLVKKGISISPNVSRPKKIIIAPPTYPRSTLKPKICSERNPMKRPIKIKTKENPVTKKIELKKTFSCNFFDFFSSSSLTDVPDR